MTDAKTPGKKRSRAILVNTFSNYLHQILQVGIFLALTPYIALRLGTNGYGLWSLIQATAGIFGLFDLGFATSVVKYIADARGKEDQTRLSSLVSTFFWIYTALGLVVLISALAFAAVLPSALNIPSENSTAAVIVFVLIAFRTAISMPLGMFRGVMTGFQQQWWANILKILATVLYAVFSWWALYFEPSIERLAMASLFSHLIAMSIGAWLCLTRLPGVTVHPRLFQKQLIGEVTSFSLYFFMIQISTLIYTRIDAIIIQTYMSLSAVAMYNVAARAAEHSSGLCRQLTNTLTPVVAELRGAGDEQNIRAVFRMGTKLSTAMAAPVLLGLFILAEPTLVAWMGEEFRAAVPACRLLLVASIISVIHGNAANILSMTGHQRFLAIVFFGGQMLNLSLTLWWIRSYEIFGVALATLVSSAFVDMVFVQRRASQNTGISQSRFYYETVGPSVFPALVMTGVLLALIHFFPPASLALIALFEAIAALTFFSVFLLTGLTEKERDYFATRLAGLRRFFGSSPAPDKENQ